MRFSRSSALIWVLSMIQTLPISSAEILTYEQDFSRHTVVRPKIYDGREKREILSTRIIKGDTKHIDDITIAMDINRRSQLLDLRLNRELIAKGYFEKHEKSGEHSIRSPTDEELEVCHYQGKLRGEPDSWAALSTCHGLSGVVFDGKELHYLERATNNSHIHNQQHYLYSQADLVTNHTCGHSEILDNIRDMKKVNEFNKRFKRSENLVRGPYNSNAQSRYVELIIVVDNDVYRKKGNTVANYCKNLVNIVNAMYVPLNIFVTLVGVVVWTGKNEIVLDEHSDTTLNNFLRYRKNKLKHPNDNAQLLTGTRFNGGVVGKAMLKGMCSAAQSGGVNMYHSEVVGLVASTVAHEMGHNFGMDHDTTGACQCPEDKCLMSPSISSVSHTHWSSCSLDDLALAFAKGIDYCLRNKPITLFDSPVCGNGFVEAGEQCDCGLKDHCDNPCCDPVKCMLFSNASCATGECCDLKTCRPKTLGYLCRETTQECDLAEYCTGHSEYCPEDVFKMDGSECKEGEAYCHKGSCRTHSDQCKLLWGPSGKSSDTQCYKDYNKNGNVIGNCGYNYRGNHFLKCQEQNLLCGSLHCTRLNEELEFGMFPEINTNYVMKSIGVVKTCVSVVVDLGINDVDPGLVPNGAKCGENKMCVDQKCVPVTKCPNNCNHNGVCNSRGHCHCNIGFAPPYCDFPGPGGSEDSGPASDPNAQKGFHSSWYIWFLGIILVIAVVSVCIYYWKHALSLWDKKPRILIVDKKLMTSPGNRVQPRDAIPWTSSLPQQSAPPTLSGHSHLQNCKIGQHNGFSVTSLAKTSSATSSFNLTPIRPAPRTAPINIVSSPKVCNNSTLM